MPAFKGTSKEHTNWSIGHQVICEIGLHEAMGALYNMVFNPLMHVHLARSLISNRITQIKPPLVSRTCYRNTVLPSLAFLPRLEIHDVTAKSDISLVAGL